MSKGRGVVGAQTRKQNSIGGGVYLLAQEAIGVSGSWKQVRNLSSPSHGSLCTSLLVN